MTELTITPKIADKTARFKGTVAAGEHVAVTIKGGAEWLGEDDGANLTLRVLDLVTGRTLAVFPRPEETYGEDEEYVPDEWGTAGEDDADLFCNLNLNTDRMVAAARHMLRVPVLFVMGAKDEANPATTRTLYFRDRYEVEFWPERVGDDTPYDLDRWPKQIDEWAEQVAAWSTRLGAMKLSAARTEAEGENPGKTTITLNDGTAQTDTVVEILDGQVTPAQMNTAIAAMGATKQNTLTFDAIPTKDSDNPVKSGGVKAAIDEVADDVTEHVGNTGIHVTAEQKTAWTAKYDKPQGGIPKGDLSAGVQASLAKADTAVQVHQSLDAYVNAAGYDSTAKEIQLKHDSTVVARIDATAFIKDGMVDSAEISGGNLVISFNTDAGVEDIEIPLTDIFNPANYYDKTAADNRFVQKETGKGLVAVDAALSPTSENPVQNKAVAAALLGKLDGAAAYPAWAGGVLLLVCSYKGRLYKLRDAPVSPNIPPDVAPWWEQVYLKDLKQDALSSAQLAAVNSGATAAKVATWDGYAAQIAQKADAADLPYALVTPGEWEFSDGGAHTISAPYEDYGEWAYELDGQGYISDDKFSTEADALAALSLTFSTTEGQIIATRASLPGHLLDRSGNLVDATTGNVTLTLPPFVAGKVRDLLVHVNLGDDGTNPYTVTVNFPSGETNTGFKVKGNASTPIPAPDAAGEWLFSFSECAPHKMAVALAQLQDATAGGS